MESNIFVKLLTSIIILVILLKTPGGDGVVKEREGKGESTKGRGGGEL